MYQLKDNQCKPSNVPRTKNFTQHVVTWAILQPWTLRCISLYSQTLLDM